MSDFYHLCFVVQDIEQATGDLSRTLGVTWSPVRDGQLGHWDYRIVFSTQGPPFFEVIQAPMGQKNRLWDVRHRHRRHLPILRLQRFSASG